MPGDNQPIGADEVESLFGAHAQIADRACALAVSGGSDSTALMVLFADWLRQARRDVSLHTVLVVDHGLRLGSADETRAVADRAAALGFRHAVLAWEGLKPHTGIQAAARVARYRLMTEHMTTHDIGCLLTAHTRDDQAETLLMRLARGSGVNGLAAMAPWTEVGARGETGVLRVFRPLLGVAKARLRTTLEARGIPWIEDPSNQSAAFERTRWRAARADLEALGLSSEMLASSARRLQRARAALEAVTDAHCAEHAGLVATDPCGVFRIDRERLRGLPEEIALRVIGRCIVAAGGSGEPVPLAGLEPIVARIWSGNAAGSWTLARAQITGGDQVVQVEREPGRLPLPVAMLTGGARESWDGRFAIEIAEGFEGSLELRALGSAGLAELRRLGSAMKGTSALALVPSFWRGNELLAVPAVGFWAGPEAQGAITATFMGLRYNSGTTADARRDDLDER
jgi:tRNA(Ile)-lysidine synthase